MMACRAADGRYLATAFCQDCGSPWTSTGRMMISPTTAAIAPAVRRVRLPSLRAKRPKSAR
jgi:hypothetical protein